MVDAGIDDVLVPYNVVGAGKLERLAALLGRSHVGVTVDDAALLAGLSLAAGRADERARGARRLRHGAGTNRRSTRRRRRPGSRGRSPGRRGCASPACSRFRRRRARAPSSRRRSRRSGGAGLPWRRSRRAGRRRCGSSGGLRPLVTEYRAGTYAFNDRNTVRAGAASLDDVALTVAATVVSRRQGHAIVDAGSKALSSEAAGDGFGLVAEAPGARVVRLDEEHGYVEPAGRARARAAGADRAQPRLSRRQPRRRAGAGSRRRDRGAVAGRARAVRHHEGLSPEGTVPEETAASPVCGVRPLRGQTLVGSDLCGVRPSSDAGGRLVRCR